MVSSCAMPSNKKKKPAEQDYAVGDRVKVNLHTGRIVDATVRAVIDHTDGKRLQVDFGKDETALVHLWQERLMMELRTVKKVNTVDKILGQTAASKEAR